MKRKPLLQSYTVDISGFKDFFRIMRISLVLLFVCALQLSAVESKAQNAEIKLSQTEMTVKQLIASIEGQTDYLVVFRDLDVDVNKVLHLNKQNAKVSDFLAVLCDEIGVDYRFEKNYITLVKRVESNDQADKRQVRGKVTDASGEPVIGATVMEKGTTNGTITDIDGNFELNVAEGATLEISYVGYQTTSIPARFGSTITVSLKEDNEMLDEVVVIG